MILLGYSTDDDGLIYNEVNYTALQSHRANKFSEKLVKD